MNPELSRAGNLRTLEAELRSAIRGCARMRPAGLKNHPKLLDELANLAGSVGDECVELEHRRPAREDVA